MSTRKGTAIDAAFESTAEHGSPRAFGYLIGVVLFVLAAFAYAHHSRWTLAFVIAGCSLALIGRFFPRLLAPFNRLWMGLGHVLGRIVSPIVMGLIYFGVVTPIALLARWRGADPMRRHFDPQASTYWIEREPPGPDPSTMERQF